MIEEYKKQKQRTDELLQINQSKGAVFNQTFSGGGSIVNVIPAASTKAKELKNYQT